MQAIGAYFDELVQLQDLKVKAVTKNAGVASNYISRLLTGDTKEPAGITLRRLNKAVGGSWDDVGRLLDDDSTEATGRAAAAQWLKQLSPDLLDAIEELKQTKAGRARIREAAQKHLRG